MATQRPNGEGATIWGAVSIIVGVIAAFMGSGAETPQGFWIAIAVANLGIGLGVLLLSLGYLVRAIWFLPGRDMSEVENTSSDGGATQQCAWCDQIVAYPYSPCSQLGEEALRRNRAKITSDKCLAALDEHGITAAD